MLAAMDETETVGKEKAEDKKPRAKQKRQYLWSWGAGTDGQLGTGKPEDEYTPQLLHTLSSSFGSISSLSCGGAHVIALTSGGKVLSWGRGSSGQLGHGQIVPNCLYPNLVDALLSFNICHVSAGWNHSGFVSDSGCLFTCGDGTFGQLGHGDYQSNSSPMEVSFFSTKHVEQVACGMRHTLALIQGKDQLYGFGSGKRGQLGVSNDKIRSLSVPQPCLGLEAVQVVAVTASGDHSAALTADDCLYTWGRSFGGRPDVRVPEFLQSSLSFKSAALGWNHALLLTGEGEAFMLGGRHHGVLGEPEKTTHVHYSSGKPRLFNLASSAGKKVLQIAAGAEHSAIVTEDGKLHTWGWGEHGQLGLGNTRDRVLPQLVDLHDVDSLNSFTTCVYCGSGFTFATRMQHTPSDVTTSSRS